MEVEILSLRRNAAFFVFKNLWERRLWRVPQRQIATNSVSESELPKIRLLLK